MFYSKLLLFGEYGIILNSKGLTTPFRKFEGTLRSTENIFQESAVTSNAQLKDFLGYIKNDLSDGIRNLIDISSLEEDVDDGLYFQSNIPQGYGVGSSGALVAAVYNNYGKEISFESGFNRLKDIFSGLESFYHGKSSGLDPLVSYLNKPILIDENKTILTLDFQNNYSDFSVFLVDTGIKRQTRNLVNHFLSNMESLNFREVFYHDFVTPTNKAITYFIENDFDSLWKELALISKFQFEHFRPMIPEGFNELFQLGFNSGDYLLKLCGSGGGGYLFGFTRNMDKVNETFQKYNLKPEVINNWL